MEKIIIFRILIISLWLICFSAVNCVAKVFVKTFPSPIPQGVELVRIILLSPKFYLMGVLYVSCAVFYMVSLRFSPLSTAGPLFLVMGSMATYSLGVFFFGESLSPMRVAGVGLCVIGICLLLYHSGPT